MTIFDATVFLFIYLFCYWILLWYLGMHSEPTQTWSVWVLNSHTIRIQSIQTLANTVWGLNMTRLLAMSAALRENQLFNFCDVKIFYLFCFYKNYVKRNNKEWITGYFQFRLRYLLFPIASIWGMRFALHH